MKNGDFIKELSKHGTTKVLATPNVRLAYWFLPTVIWCLGAVFFVEHDVVFNVLMSFQFGAMLLFVLWTAKWVFELSIPGSEDKYEIPYLMIPLGLWLISMGVNTLNAGIGHDSQYMFYHGCFNFSLLAAMGPTALLYWFGVKAAPMKRKEVSALCMIVGVGIGSLVSQATCPLVESAHLMVSHYLPVIILASLGYVFGKKVFN